jgi:hypothetical protein
VSRYFHFRWNRASPTPRSILAIAGFDIPFERTQVLRVFDDDILENLRPDEIVFILPSFLMAEYEAGLQTLLNASIPLRFEPAVTPISLLTFDASGSIAEIRALVGAPTILISDFAAIKYAGLRDIVVRRDVVIRPAPGLHFVHPSGDHSLAFARAGNALVRGNEILFIAATLLPNITSGIRTIWIDSSSIIALPYAMFSLLHRFNSNFVPPQVESFSSYPGLRAKQVEYEPGDLFMISATATGQMARDISEMYRVDLRDVINVFSLASDSVGLNVLCDLRNMGFGDIPSPHTFKPSQCPRCKEQSSLIRFVGDQFLTNAIDLLPWKIIRDDAPRELSSQMTLARGKGVFKLQRAESSHVLWVDIEPLLSEDSIFVRALNKAVNRYAPASVSHIVAADEGQSQGMAEVIRAQLARISTKNVAVVSRGQIRNLAPEDVSGALIVAAAIGSGTILEAISKDLRDVMGAKPRAYMIGYAKSSETSLFKTLIGNLEFNRPDHKHEVTVINPMTLPFGATLAAWMREEELWQEALEDVRGGNDDQLTTFMTQRTEALSASTLSSLLFLPDARGAPLQIRQTFAFWDGEYAADSVSQVDVFSTIASVLEHGRRHVSRSAIEPKLPRSPFHQGVVAPENFSRFNDGIMQAALLRSALPHELNFAGNSDLSAQMSRIVRRALERWQDTQGEAVGEFLLALATRRLILGEEDVKGLYQFVIPDRNRAPNWLAWLRERALGNRPAASLAKPSQARPTRPKRGRSHSLT